MSNKRMCEFYPMNCWMVFTLQWSNGSHTVHICKNTIKEFEQAADSVSYLQEVEAYLCRSVSDMKIGETMDTEDRFVYLKPIKKVE